MSLWSKIAKPFREFGAAERRREHRLAFIGVGAQKAGTTTLRRVLSLHPQLEVPDRETHFFDDDRIFALDHRPLAGNYGGLQARFTLDRVASGEVTPIYLYWRGALERIRLYNPAVRLIVLLRNPVMRAYSQWGMQVEKGQSPKSFNRTIAIELEGLAGNPDFQDTRLSLVARGLYAPQIARARSLFPGRAVDVHQVRGFLCRPDPRGGRYCPVHRCRATDQSGPRRARPHSREGSARPIAPAEWEDAFAHFAGDIAVVERQLGWDCSDWRKPPRSAT